MSTGASTQPAEWPSEAFADGWRDTRANSDIQYAEVPLPDTPPPPATPDWLVRFFDWLGDLLAPAGAALVESWPVLKWVLLGIAVLLVLLLVWRVIDPARFQRRKPAPEAEWQPDQQAALALLEEADRLAAEGRFDEATHLLLLRSVGQIAAARPDLIDPSSTAREIAAQPSLPGAARTAFAIIAERVERSLFALRQLSADDWQAARSAYAEFALAQKSLGQKTPGQQSLVAA